MSLRLRIALLVAGIVLTVGAITAIWSAQVVEQAERESLREHGLELARTVVGNVLRDVLSGDVITSRDTLSALVKRIDSLRYAYIRDLKGAFFADSFSEGFPSALLDFPPGDVHEYHYQTPEGSVLHLQVPLLEGTAGSVHLGMDKSRLDRRLYLLRTRILLTSVFLALVGILTGVWLAGRLTRPLVTLGNMMQAYGRGEAVEPQSTASSAPEISSLSIAFARMVKERRQVDEALKSLNRELEEKIDERTKRLRKSETFLNETGRVARMGGWELDVATKEVRWTSETYRIYEVLEDYKPLLEEVINFFHPDDRGRVSKAIQQAMEKGIPYDMEIRFITANGRQLWTRTVCKPEVVDGKTVLLRGIFQDITERKQAEERSTRLGRIIERSFNEIYVFDTESLKFIEVNHGACANLGYSMEELHNLTPLDLKPEFTQKSFEEHIGPLRRSEKEIVVFETVHKRKDGSLYNVEIHLQLMREETPPVFVAIIQDTTERKRMQSMMVQTEKMMSVGGLAAGMAHELNNPLAGILQGLQNIQRRLSPELEKNQEIAQELGVDLKKVYSYIDQRGIKDFFRGISESGERAAVIVNNMLQFARKAESKLHPENLDQLVDQALELAAVDYDLKKKYDFRGIEIVREYDSALPQVDCIASEIQQVLLNIFRNAAQALFTGVGETEPPRIILRIQRINEMACIEIKDNGHGMGEEIRSHVFDPFFTTRPVGEGTGLGLSVSYFIVTEEHNGRMSVHSKPGHGTTFTVCLPLIEIA
ncbi:MAG: PAS domain S-box protein [Candidatus Sedimenticola sp. (ex Thyasira tokunagai)]